MTSEPPLKVTDVARALNVSEESVKRWLNQGKFPGAFRVGARGDWRIPPEAVEAVKDFGK